MRVQGLTPIDWVDGAMWIVEPEYRSWELQVLAAPPSLFASSRTGLGSFPVSAQHIFFWAHSVFGLWEARVGNESWGNPMPPLDELWILKPRSIVLNKWNAASLDIITAGFNTKVNDLGDM